MPPIRPCLLVLLTAVTAFAQPGGERPPAPVSLTIYSSADPAGFDPQQFIAQARQGYHPQYVWQVPGFGVVRETRSIAVDDGINTVDFVDVAQFIDPTTVSFLDLENPDETAVLEQNFLFDLMSASKLLERMIDREVTVSGVTGKLLAANQGRLIIETQDGVRIMGYHDQVDLRLSEMPEGLLTKPTLRWLIDSSVADADRRVRTSYQTGGITWRSDYNLILNEDDTAADLGAWVSILNLSGKAYEDAQLKLIAGDVQRVQPQGQLYVGYDRAMRLREEDRRQGFEEKAFYEYHLYTLPRATTVADNTTQQVMLFPTAAGVPVEKVLVYYGLPEDLRHFGFFPEARRDRDLGTASNTKVDVYLRFENREANNLGMPLPRGKVRVYKQDAADGTLEFVGEDLIDHTPRDETVLVKTGQAFDVVGERTQTDFREDWPAFMDESFRIQIRNHKDEPVKVIVKENLFRWTNWKLTDHSHDFEKVDSRTVHFPVDVPARGEVTVTYTVRYSGSPIDE